MVVFKIANWTDVQHQHQSRHSCVIFIEFLTLIPSDGIYYTLQTPAMKTIYLLRLRYVLRTTRLLVFYTRNKKYIVTTSSLVQLLQVMAIIFLMIVFLSAIVYTNHCMNTTKICSIGEDKALYKIIFLEVTTRLINLGMNNDMTVSENAGQILLTLIFCISFVAFIFNAHIISNVICDALHCFYEKFALTCNYERLCTAINKWKYYNIKSELYEDYEKIARNVYSLLWSKKRGIVMENITGKYLLKVMFKEISLDVMWDALQHSHLFRNESPSYLRYISTLMTHQFLSPGQFIFKKNELKSKMVFISSGVIDILSAEDNESPLISLSDGTCLGESTLLIDYYSTSSVVCRSFCELMVLERKHFVTSSKLYPKRILKAMADIKNRYNFGREFSKMCNYQNLYEHDITSQLSLCWIKYTLRKLLGQNIESYEVENKLQKLTFCPKYLDLLVMAPAVELITDSIFIEFGFPFILQPVSVFQSAWNGIIIFWSILFVILYPYNCFFALTVTNYYLTFQYFISFLWWIDLLTQIMTAVKEQKHFYTNIKDIFTYRIRTYSFLLDILSVFSPSFTLILLNYQLSKRLQVVLEFTKLFKFYRVNNYISSTLGTSTNTLIIFKYIDFMLYVLLLNYYLAGLFNGSGCFDFKCSSDYKEFLKTKTYIIPTEMLLYQLYSTVKLLCNFEQEIYTKFTNYYLVVTAYFLFYVCNAYFLGQMCASETLQNMNINDLSEYTKNLFSVVKSMKTSTKMEKLVWKFLDAKYQYHKTIFLHDNNIYKQLPSHLVKLIHGLIAKQYLQYVPILNQFNNKVIAEVSSKMKIRIHPKSSIVVFKGEICQEIYIIIKGQY